MIKQVVGLFQFIWDVIVKFVVDNSMNYAGSIAFFTIFSLPGILIGVMLLAGPVFGEDVVRSELFSQISVLVGPSSAKQVNSIVKNLEQADFSLFALIIAVTTLIYGSTSVFASIQDGINVIWGVRSKPKQVALKFLFNRLLSMAMIATIGFLMLVSLAAETVMQILNDSFVSTAGSKGTPIIIISEQFTFAVIVFVVFTAIYKVLPDAKVAWSDLFRGALLSTVLFMIGKFLIGLYLGKSSFATAYGTAGSLVMLLIWVYYSSMILLFGAEFIEVFTRSRGRIIKPNQDAMKIITKEVQMN